MAIDIKTKYITPDDFKLYFGIDLQAELKDITPDAFIMRVEDRVEVFLNSIFYRNIDKEYPEFSDFQKIHYAKALLEQAFYMFKSGDILSDSGYDYDKGVVATNEQIEQKSIAIACKQHLLTCGLWCRLIKNKRSGLRLW